MNDPTIPSASGAGLGPAARPAAETDAVGEVTLAPPVLAGPVADRRPAPDSMVRTMLGLLVVWASLFMVFMAHYESDRQMGVRWQVDSGPNSQREIFSALEPRQTLLLPFDMHAPRLSPRDALLNIAGLVGCKVDQTMLHKMQISDKPVGLRFQGRPLYQVIHQLIGDPDKGFALVDRNLIVFPQQLTSRSTQDKGQFLDWKAQLRLAHQQMLVVPSGQTDIWFSIHLMNAATEPARGAEAVQVEVWKGSELVTMVKGNLDEGGNAQLTLSTVENIRFSILRQQAATRDQPGLFDLEFLYQSFT